MFLILLAMALIMSSLSFAPSFHFAKRMTFSTTVSICFREKLMLSCARWSTAKSSCSASTLFTWRVESSTLSLSSGHLQNERPLPSAIAAICVAKTSTSPAKRHRLAPADDVARTRGQRRRAPNPKLRRRTRGVLMCVTTCGGGERRWVGRLLLLATPAARAPTAFRNTD